MSSDGASAEPLAAEDPRQIGRFVVTGRLGAGAMGVVYAAYDPQLGRRVAVKLLGWDSRGPDDAWQGRLLREAQALARLSHPNVVQVHEVGEHAGGVFLAMEYVPGVSLQTWLSRQKRSWGEIAAVFAEAGRGLAAAHAAGLVHRDVKPENLLVGDDGRVRVVDFGLARLEGEPEAEEGPAASLPSATLASPTRTAPGALVGTPAYMSPEQFRGQPADALSDQFSLCVALYEALFGERPFVGATAREVSRSVLSGEIAARRDTTRGVPGWLLRAVLRGLRSDRAARWPDVQALVDELSRDRSARRRLARWTGGLLLGSGVVIAATSWALGVQARRARERAEVSAAAHLAAASASIDGLLAEGRAAQAAAVLEAFLAVPEHRGTQAVARALHEWGGRMKARGDRAAARISFARAYSAAADAEMERAVLGELAALFRDEWAWDALVSLCVVAGPAPSGHPRELPCAEARLARRDLGGPFPGELAELGSILSSWSSGIRTDRSADVGGVVAGSDPLQLFTYHRGSGRLELVRSDPSLTQVRSLTQPRLADRPGLGPVALSPASAPLALTWSAAQRRVGVVGEGDELVSFAADEPLSAAAADLDGDGQRELYVGTGPFGRELLALHRAGGTWRVEHPHAGTDATNSDINALVAADLDGDGRDELAVAAGPWRAFDVRVLRPEPGAGLGLVARRKLGNVAALATLRLGDERVLVAAKTDAYPSRLAFPAGPAAGAPAGLYLLRLRGRELETVGLLAAPARAGAPRPHDFSRLLVGDIDADGRDDLVATALDPESGPLITCLFRQLDGGRFARATLGGLEPIALTNVDDDAALELVARGVGPGEGQLWLLGAGAERPAPGAPARSPLPSLPSSQAPPLATVATLTDPILIRSWQRAEQLAALGLHAEAARSVDDLSRFSAEPQAHAHVLRRAAELYEAAGEFLAAAERFEGAAEELGTPALEGAARCYEQAERFADALRIDRLLELRSDLPRAEALRVRNRAQQLAEIVDGVPRAELLLEAALRRSWLFDDPLAVRRELGGRGLSVEAFAGRGPIARAPVEWSSSTLGFSVELDLRRAEWGSGLLVGLRLPGSPSPVAAVGLEVLGGGGVYRRRLVCYTPGGREPHVLVEEPGDETERPAQLRLELDVFPGLDLVTCSARVGPDAAPRTRRFQLGGDAPLAPGRYELVVLPRGFAAPSGLWSSAELRSVELRGAKLVGGFDEGPRARAARLLIEGDFEATLAEPGVAPLWRAFALSELGRWPDASEELRRVSVDDPEVRADLASLLRTRGPTLAPILRAALGRRYLRLAWEAIEAAVTQHPDDRLIGRVLTTAFAELDEVELHPDPRERPILARLLLERGRAWARLGQPERARRDLERAALLRDPAPDGPALEDIEVELAALALAGGALAEARGLARRALEAARARELVADRLRADPRFAALSRDPDWLALLAD